MKTSMKAKAFALLAAAGLGLSACNSGTPGASDPTRSGATGSAPEYKVATDVKLTDSPTWTRAESNGKIKIGVKYDQPGLGYKSAGKDTPEGFDIEIAKLAAASLGFGPDKIEWVEAVSKNRIPFLQNNQVDLVVGTFTMNDERKQVVDFAGPYYTAGMDFLVAKDSPIKGKADLEGKKVCSVNGSSTEKDLNKYLAEGMKFEVKYYDSYSKCVQDLDSGQVEVVSTDDSILRGFAKQYDGKFKVVGDPQTKEPYGIGLPKGDAALREKLNGALEEAKKDGTTEKAFEFTLGSAEGVTFPDVDRY